MHRQKSTFDRMVEAMGNTGDVMLRYYYQRKDFMDSINARKEREELVEEITNEVLSRISIRLETEALKELEEMLRNLGK